MGANSPELNTAVRVAWGAARRVDESTGVDEAFQRAAAREVVTEAVWALIDEALAEVSNYDRAGLAGLNHHYQGVVLRSAARHLTARAGVSAVAGGAL